MRKIKPIALALLAFGAVGLTGCDFLSNLPIIGGLFGGKEVINPIDENGELDLATSGGTEDDKQAIHDCINGSLVSITSQDALAGTDLKCFGTSNDYILIADNYQGIDITWEWDSKQAAFRRASKYDEGVRLIELNYPQKGEAETTFKMRMTKAKIGSCSTKKGQILEYVFTLKPNEFAYQEVSVHDMCKMDPSNPEHYAIINYDQTNPYFVPNDYILDENGKKTKEYQYVKTYGEVVYLTPDGNWGLLANGEDVIEIYAGSALTLTTQRFPSLQVGKNVEIWGEMGQYCGNIQISYIVDVKDAPSNANITPAKKSLSDYKAVTATDIANWAADGKHKQGVANQMNALKYVEGTVKSVSATFSVGKRSTAVLTVGNQELTVAYDYHICGGKNPDDFVTPETSALKAKFQQLTVGKSVKIYGTMRYNGNDEGKVFGVNTGFWNLVPFQADHIIYK